MKNIIIDFNKCIGKIKPMNGVGQPPLRGINFSMFDYLKNAHIPYSRLHDVGGAFGGNIYVDIPNIFRDFSKDPENPENYDFAFTDLLITELVNRGIEPFFRLGVTIENNRKIKAYRINPPEDYEKWAKICEGIIRHYTENWANGFNYKITYWEIWNEPNNFEDPNENQMWTGTAEDYYELYEVSSKYLKSKFPHLKIGGYASCGFYALTESSNEFAACSPRYSYFLDFFEGFLDYVKTHNCPLDYFSWHSYSGVKENIIWTNYVRKRLDECGFKTTEHTLNEWNCHPNLKGTIKHAALTCANMLALQNTSLDSAMFYDARCTTGYCSGLFNCMTYEPLPAYYSFCAFGELYLRENQVFMSDLPDNVYALAAKDKDGCIVITNLNETEIDLELEILGANEIIEAKIITENKVWEYFDFENKIPKESVICLKLKLE